MKKLISMTDFVLDVGNPEHTDYQFANLVIAYANFLKQPLTLGMFVPCDEGGNVLEEPERWKDYLNYPDSFDGNKEWYGLYAYEQAKERVLFEFFDIPRDRIGLDRFKRWLELKDTVEQLVRSNLTLTPYALKQIGL